MKHKRLDRYRALYPLPDQDPEAEIRASARTAHQRVLDRLGNDAGLLSWRSSPSVLFLACCLSDPRRVELEWIAAATGPAGMTP